MFYYVAQAALEFLIGLPQSPQCGWGASNMALQFSGFLSTQLSGFKHIHTLSCEHHQSSSPKTSPPPQINQHSPICFQPSVSGNLALQGAVS